MHENFNDDFFVSNCSEDFFYDFKLIEVVFKEAKDFWKNVRALKDLNSIF